MSGDLSKLIGSRRACKLSTHHHKPPSCPTISFVQPPLRPSRLPSLWSFTSVLHSYPSSIDSTPPRYPHSPLVDISTLHHKMTALKLPTRDEQNATSIGMTGADLAAVAKILQGESALDKLRGMVRDNPTSFTSINIPPRRGITVGDVLHHIRKDLMGTLLATSVMGSTIRVIGEKEANLKFYEKYSPSFEILNRHNEKVLVFTSFIQPPPRSTHTAPSPIYRIRLSNLVRGDTTSCKAAVEETMRELGLDSFSVEEEEFGGVTTSNLVVVAPAIPPQLQVVLRDLYTVSYETNDLIIRPVNFCCFCLELYVRNKKHECEESNPHRGRSRGPSRGTRSRQASARASRTHSPEPKPHSDKGKEPEDDPESPPRSSFGNVSGPNPPTPPKSTSGSSSSTRHDSQPSPTFTSLRGGIGSHKSQPTRQQGR